MNEIQELDGISVYEVEPEGPCLGGLILIHEVWGLTDHIKDVARRFAKEGYHVLAPNLLSGTDIENHISATMQQDLFNPEKRSFVQPVLRKLMAPLQTSQFSVQTIKKLKSCFNYLYQNSTNNMRVSVVGYCFGGSYSFNLATEEPLLNAAVAYYGHANFNDQQLAEIQCPILAFYGENDQDLISGLPKLEEAWHRARVDFAVEVYGETGHAFFNDTNPYAYNKIAAEQSWRKTLNFLKETKSV